MQKSERLMEFTKNSGAWLKDMKDAPTYYPTAQEFEDPMRYIQSIQAEASKYGKPCQYSEVHILGVYQSFCDGIIWSYLYFSCILVNLTSFLSIQDEGMICSGRPKFVFWQYILFPLYCYWIDSYDGMPLMLI